MRAFERLLRETRPRPPTLEVLAISFPFPLPAFYAKHGWSSTIMGVYGTLPAMRFPWQRFISVNVSPMELTTMVGIERRPSLQVRDRLA